MENENNLLKSQNRKDLLSFENFLDKECEKTDKILDSVNEALSYAYEKIKPYGDKDVLVLLKQIDTDMQRLEQNFQDHISGYIEVYEECKIVCEELLDYEDTIKTKDLKIAGLNEDVAMNMKDIEMLIAQLDEKNMLIAGFEEKIKILEEIIESKSNTNKISKKDNINNIIAKFVVKKAGVEENKPNKNADLISKALEDFKEEIIERDNKIVVLEKDIENLKKEVKNKEKDKKMQENKMKRLNMEMRTLQIGLKKRDVELKKLENFSKKRATLASDLKIKGDDIEEEKQSILDGKNSIISGISNTTSNNMNFDNRKSRRLEMSLDSIYNNNESRINSIVPDKNNDHTVHFNLTKPRKSLLLQDALQRKSLVPTIDNIKRHSIIAEVANAKKSILLNNLATKRKTEIIGKENVVNKKSLRFQVRPSSIKFAELEKLPDAIKKEDEIIEASDSESENESINSRSSFSSDKHKNSLHESFIDSFEIRGIKVTSITIPAKFDENLQEIKVWTIEILGSALNKQNNVSNLKTKYINKNREAKKRFQNVLDIDLIDSDVEEDLNRVRAATLCKYNLNQKKILKTVSKEI